MDVVVKLRDTEVFKKVIGILESIVKDDRIPAESKKDIEDKMNSIRRDICE